MRRRFKQQLRFGTVPINEVALSKKSRHELPKLLMGLQHIFTTSELNEAVFGILEERIMKGKQVTGRIGMSLWEVFVLGTIRLGLDIDYDHLEDLANNHRSLRGILGVARGDFSPGKQYAVQTIKENVGLLDEQTLKQINEVVVKAGHELVKKKRRGSPWR